MKHEELLYTALKRYDKGTSYWSENWKLAEEDLEFLAGEQWPEKIKKERENDGRPCITINRLPTFVRRLVGDQRQFRPAIKVRPVDSGADPELAEIYTGLIRQIEYQSKAKQVYDWAFWQAVACGMGFWKITTEYAAFDTFEQDIFIKRILNPFGVVFDPSATEFDLSDAKWCFVTEWIPKEEFKARFPGKEPIDFERAQGMEQHWVREDEVLIAEYWVKKPVKKRLALLSTGEVIEVTEGLVLPEDVYVVREREVETHRVEYYLLSGSEVLEGPKEWPSRYIPIVPVLGEEIYVDDKRYYQSLIRWAKDPQRLYNYWRSAATEHIALSPKSPFLATPKQIEGHERMWADANRKNLPYLLYNPDTQAGGAPRRQPPPPVPAGIITEAQVAVDDIKATTGLFDASLGAQGNETSGRAIIARQRQGDTATYVWPDNLATAIALTGKILVDLIPKIYDTERVIRVLGEDGTEKMVEINKVVMDENGETVIINDLTVGKYDVVVETGPSYSTKRTEAVESILSIIQSAPDLMKIAGDLLVKNMDWPGADELAKRLKKVVPPEIREPEEGEPAPAEQPPMPDPKMMLDMKKLELEDRKLELEAQKIETEKMKLAQKDEDLTARIRQVVIDTLEEVFRPQEPPAGTTQ